jgi:hypothetical protein
MIDYMNSIPSTPNENLQGLDYLMCLSNDSKMRAELAEQILKRVAEDSKIINIDSTLPSITDVRESSKAFVKSYLDELCSSMIYAINESQFTVDYNITATFVPVVVPSVQYFTTTIKPPTTKDSWLDYDIGHYSIPTQTVLQEAFINKTPVAVTKIAVRNSTPAKSYYTNQLLLC